MVKRESTFFRTTPYIANSNIFQWHWTCANNWGCHKKTENCCRGCGPQETFRGCADISIKGSGMQNISIPITTTLKPEKAQVATTTGPTVITTTSASKTTKATSVDSTMEQNSENCHAIPPFDNNPGMDSWCRANCKVGNCPTETCSCQ